MFRLELSKKKPGNRAVAVVFAVVALGIAIASWKFLHPRIRTATYGEVIATLPKELLVSPNQDPDAEARLVALFNALQAFDLKEFSLLGFHPGRTSLQAMGAADKVWHDGRFAKIIGILKSGPIQFPVAQSRGRRRGYVGPRDPNELYSKLKQVAKGLVDSASMYQANGDRGEAMFCLRSLIQLTDRSWGLHGAMVQYFVSASIEFGALRAITNYARDPMSSITDCNELLEQLPAAPEGDQRLADCLRTQFQQNILPKLPDPYRNLADRNGNTIDSSSSTEARDQSFETSYDALETSEQFGKVYAIEIANAVKPFNQFDNSAEKIQRNARKHLPMAPNRDDGDERMRQVEFLKYRVATYNTDNYLGRAMISMDFDGLNLVDRSAVCRSIRNAVRVLLASRLYRNSHNGKLPMDERGFLEALGSWPNDPFTGRPMKYRYATSAVYSIGRDLVDNGGNFSGFTYDNPDVGLFLTFDR